MFFSSIYNKVVYLMVNQENKRNTSKTEVEWTICQWMKNAINYPVHRTNYKT